jgi:hypothetical protein
VFVVYSPGTARERDIMQYIICRLEEYFDVVTSSDIERGDIMKLVEEHERKANAILLVCTEEFRLEWEEKVERSLVVLAIQTLLSSAVIQERLDKYALLVLDDKSREEHIPDNHYLSNMGVHVLGKEKDQSVMEDLYRFVTKQVPFQHCHMDRENRESSTASVPSTIESGDLKSRCTESVSIDLGSSVGSIGYSSLHFDQFLPKKDVSLQTESRIPQSESSRSSGQFDNERKLLTILQPVDALFQDPEPGLL